MSNGEESSVNEKADNSFRAQALAFLISVKNRDLKSFPEFIDPNLGLTAILPGGRRISGAEAFLESQQKWFSGTTGVFSFSNLKAEESGDLGFCTVDVEYQDQDANGSSFTLEIYISFVFKRCRGKWFLIHDQNTVLRELR